MRIQHRLGRWRDRRMRALLVTLGALALAAPAAAQEETPSAEDILKRVGFSDADRKQVLAGEFVERSLESTTERDLAAALAFLVPGSPEEFVQEILREKLIIRVDPNTLDQGSFEGDGSLDDLSGLTLSAEEKKLYANAEAGEDLNLSSAEIAALEELDGNEGAVEEAMKKILLARYRAYKKGGLARIAPYDRGGDSTDAGGDLRKASDAAKGFKTYDPSFYTFLHEYPKNPEPDLEEVFHWSRYNAHDQPTLILTHGFTTRIGPVIAAVQRQYYVSRGYNAEQAIAGFLPVTEGTLVVYTNHTSTDQVTGFGGGAKRSIGAKVMASQLQDLYQEARTSAEKQ